MNKLYKSLTFGLIIFLTMGIGVVAIYYKGFFKFKQKSNSILPSTESRKKVPQLINNSQNSEFKPTPILEQIPQQKTLAGNKHLFQTFNNCGPASLTMALSHYSIEVTQQQLGEELRPYQNSQGNNDDKSVTLRELAQKVEDEYGLIAYYRPSGNIELLQQFIAINIPIITRTWLSVDEDIGHYRLVRGYDQNQQMLIQDDSLQGQGLHYSYQEFNQIWQAFNFEFLVLVPQSQQAEVEQILGPLVDERAAWDQAEQLANQQILKNPDDIYAQFNLLVAQYHQSNYQEVITIYEEIQDKLPSRMLWYQIEPILAYYQLKDYQQVLSLTDQIFAAQNRAFSELHYLRGLVYQQQNQDQLSQEAFSLAEHYNEAKYWKTNLVGVEI